MVKISLNSLVTGECSLNDTTSIYGYLNRSEYYLL